MNKKYLFCWFLYWCFHYNWMWRPSEKFSEGIELDLFTWYGLMHSQLVLRILERWKRSNLIDLRSTALTAFLADVSILHPLKTPEKAFGFLVFSWGIKWEHWPEICWVSNVSLVYMKSSGFFQLTLSKLNPFIRFFYC